MTTEQAEAVGRLVQGYTLPVDLRITEGTFDLPEGYLSFRLQSAGGSDLYGGIAPDGGIST